MVHTALIAAAIGRAALMASRHPTISYYMVLRFYVNYLINSFFSRNTNDNMIYCSFIILCLTVGADRPRSAKVQRTRPRDPDVMTVNLSSRIGGDSVSRIDRRLPPVVGLEKRAEVPAPTGMINREART